MTTQELQKRNKRAGQLRVLQTDDGTYFVESQAGKICYRVNFNDEQTNCTCGDFARGIKKDPYFTCKHILAVISCLGDEGPVPANIMARNKPKLNEQFITNIQGNDFVKYSGLLDLAHQKGLMGLEIETIQYPTKANGMEAICKATAHSSLGEVFVDIGDANPNNTSTKISKHLLRMASTRAKARVLRDMNNIGMTALEELADIDEVIGAKPATRKPATRNPAAIKTAPKKEESKPVTKEPVAKKSSTKKATKPEPVKKETKTESGPTLSNAQLRAIGNLSRRRGISEADMKNMVTEMFELSSIEKLTSTEAAQFIRTLQQAA